MPTLPINDSDQSLCYVNYVWNSDNEKYRFKFMTDDDNIETLLRGNSVFFHLTNCFHDGVVDLNPRQACAVESTARVNPHLDVYLAYTSQVGFLNKTRLPIIDAIMSYPNVHIRNLDLIKYSEDTPAENWIKEGKLYESKYFYSHVSDYLRLVSLYRWGGTYCDLDIIMLKNISSLGENYSGEENPRYVANAFMNFDRNSRIGHKVGKLLLTQFRDTYNPEYWSINGPLLLTEVLEKLCHTNKTAKMTRVNCEGFHVYDSSYFYAVDYRKYPQAFSKNPEAVKSVLALIKNSTAVHLTNGFSYTKYVEVDSAVPYAVLAEMYCPKVYHSLGTVF